MKKNKKYILPIIAVFILLVYLLFADKLILILCGKSNDIKHIDSSSVMTTGKIYSAFDNMYSLDNFTHDYYIQGWAFVPSDSLGEYNERQVAYENLDKKITLYLKSSKDSYEIPTEPVSRLDITWTFKDTANVHGVYHGYSAAFSTVGIRDGIYDLYIRSDENEKDWGIGNSGTRFLKDGKNFYLYDGNDDSEITDNPIVRDMEFHIDGVFSETSGQLGYEGWGLCPELDPAESQAYIKVTDILGEYHYFTAAGQFRQDLADAFQVDSYAMAGIKGAINIKSFAEGELSLQLIIENNGNYYESSSSIPVLYKDGTVSLKQ